MKLNTYTSPMAYVCHLESEGVLCASGGADIDVTQSFDDLPDYSPSEGEW